MVFPFRKLLLYLMIPFLSLPNHSIGESRYIIIGISRFGQLLIVAHTDRLERVRIISARKATRQEQRFYEEGY
jgi:uncharacterized protein